MFDIIHCREKNSVNNPCYSGSLFRIRPSHVNLNWIILSQANPRPYGNQVFCVSGVVTKLKCFIYINARMAQFSLPFWKTFGLDTVRKHQTPSRSVRVRLLIA